MTLLASAGTLSRFGTYIVHPLPSILYKFTFSLGGNIFIEKTIHPVSLNNSLGINPWYYHGQMDIESSIFLSADWLYPKKRNNKSCRY